MNWKFWRKKKDFDKMSFQETLDLTGIPIITFKQGNRKYNFLLDTGANYSVINASVVEHINHSESTIGSTSTYGMEGNMVTANFINIKFTYRYHEYSDDFQVIDMSNAFNNIKNDSGVTLHGIIGNNFMQKYQYVLDFKEMVAYSQK